MEETEIKKECNKEHSGRRYGFKKKGSRKFNKNNNHPWQMSFSRV